MQPSQHDKHHWLATISPELLVAVPPQTAPVIVDVAPKLAAWTGNTKQGLLGRSLTEVFDPVIPGLAVVVEEVCNTGTPIRDYRIPFRDAAGRERIVIVQASLKPGRSPQGHSMVALQLEEAPRQHRQSAHTGETHLWYGMVGNSAALQRIFRKIEIYGPTEAPVLITGETGTGKELVARALHLHSHRRQRAFLAVNCAALSEELLESELFGHEKGAFTGALRTHKGRFERAHGGTLFLDEIGDMPLRIQAKLLRVLEAGVIERVGGEQEIHTDVRLEAATNVPLELAVQDGTFRADLYHRLAVLRLHLPPLRERREDIPILVAHFLQALNQRYQRHVQRLTPEALAVLAEYPWPGNVRELRNVLERVYIEATTSVIGASAFEEWAYEQSQYFSNFWRPERTQHPLTPSTALMTPYAGVYRALPPGPGAAAHAPPIDVAPESFTYLDHAPSPPAASRAAYPQGGPRALTQQRLVQAYRQAAGNITEAARLLGVHRATLYRRLKRFGITRDDLEDEAPWPSLPNASGHGQASGVPSQEETHES